MEVENRKPHAVCIPFPFQGHIKPMMKLAKLLHYKGFHITYVNTEFNHRRMLESAGQSSLDGLPDFQFVTIPDGLPPSSDPDATQDFLCLCESTTKNFMTPFRDLLAKLNDTATSKVPPVTCIIADVCLIDFPVTVAEELGIPVTLFFISATCSFMVIKQYGALKEKGLLPLKDESYLTNGYLDTTIDWIPGIKEIRLRDLPSYVRTTDPNDFMFNFSKKIVESAPRDCPIIFHSFDALEPDVLDALTPMFPNSYAIGPLQLLLNQIPENPSKLSIGDNLWKEDIECLQWLNSWPPNSVVYVNFGSLTVMTPEELIEFGWGLANSKHPFLWIIRPDLVIGDAAILPPEFVADTKERGMVASWCPQEAVLNHPSIGGFLTHCGWNSVVESISAGVPMLCWPFFVDHPTICRYTCTEWGIGMEIGGNVKSSEVEKLVRELMEGEKSKKMKKNVIELRKKAEEATAPNGSSSTNLDKVVKKLLASKK